MAGRECTVRGDVLRDLRRNLALLCTFVAGASVLNQEASNLVY